MIAINLAILFFAIFILFVIHRFFIKPYLGILFYKKQGLDMKFYPMGTGILDFQKDGIEKGDYFHSGLKLIENDPKIKGFGFNTMHRPHIFLNDLTSIKEFVLNIKDFEKTDMFYPFKKYGEEGIFFLDIPNWKRHRKIMTSIFHFEYLNQMVPLSATIASEMFNKWQSGQKSIKNTDMLQLFTRINGEIVGQLFFGEKFSQYTVKGLSYPLMVEEMLRKGANVVRHPAQLVFGGKFLDTKLLKCHRDYFDILQDFYKLSETILENKLQDIKEMKQNGTYKQNPKLKKSLAELFYEMRENNNPEQSLSNTEIMHEFTSFFTAGTDTTSHLTYMATYYYITNPQYQERLLQEVNDHFKSGEALTGEDLGKMTFMTAFLKETLRLFGPSSGHLGKQAVRDTQIGDIKIKKGTLVNIQFPILHQNPLYYENPKTFDPERWLNPNSQTMQSIKSNPYCYIPFYAGPKNCIGQNLAMMNSKILLSQFIKMFNGKLSDPNYNLRRTIKFMVCPVDKIHLDLEAK